MSDLKARLAVVNDRSSKGIGAASAPKSLGEGQAPRSWG